MHVDSTGSAGSVNDNAAAPLTERSGFSGVLMSDCGTIWGHKKARQRYQRPWHGQAFREARQ